MQVYKENKTSLIFRTNYIDYFNGVMQGLSGLLPLADVSEIDVSKDEFFETPLADYRIIK